MAQYGAQLQTFMKKKGINPLKVKGTHKVHVSALDIEGIIIFRYSFSLNVFPSEVDTYIQHQYRYRYFLNYNLHFKI
jgi:hypothetical protein